MEEPDWKEKYYSATARIAALTAHLEDADARINELDALLREWSSGAKVKGLEAEVAQLRSGIHPPVNPMPGGFSLENFMPGLKPEDADAFCEALDAASPDLSEKQGTFSDKIVALEAQLDAVPSALARKDAALGMAVEAGDALLAEAREFAKVIPPYANSEAIKGMDAALAACREAMGGK
jgi:hypothetical protein